MYLFLLCLDTTQYYGCGYDSEGGPYSLLYHYPNLTGPGFGIAFLIMTGLMTICGTCMFFFEEDENIGKEVPHVKTNSH